MSKLTITVAAVALALGATATSGAGSGAEVAALGFVRDGEISLTALDGSPARKLTQGAGDAGQFAWSPDGRRIAFVRSYDAPSSPTPSPSVIFVINADGSGQRRVAGNATSPAWRPDP